MGQYPRVPIPLSLLVSQRLPMLRSPGLQRARVELLALLERPESARDAMLLCNVTFGERHRECVPKLEREHRVAEVRRTRALSFLRREH